MNLASYHLVKISDGVTTDVPVFGVKEALIALAASVRVFHTIPAIPQTLGNICIMQALARELVGVEQRPNLAARCKYLLSRSELLAPTAPLMSMLNAAAGIAEST